MPLRSINYHLAFIIVEMLLQLLPLPQSHFHHAAQLVANCGRALQS